MWVFIAEFALQCQPVFLLTAHFPPPTHPFGLEEGLCYYPEGGVWTFHVLLLWAGNFRPWLPGYYLEHHDSYVVGCAVCAVCGL